MTAKSILATALSFIGEKVDGSDYADLAVFWLNILLQEALPTENSIRAHSGKPILNEAPEIESIDDGIDYAGSITRIALPYGIASFVYANEDDLNQAADNRNKYIAALDEAMKLKETPIVDVYGEYDNA